LLDKFLKITLSLAKKIFNGKKPKDIDTDSLTNLTNKTIKQAMSVGMEYDLSKKDTDILRNNIFIFSAAKSYAQLIEMSTLLVDADGNIRTFEEFKKEVEALNIKFNRAWLQTEYQLAVTTTQNITRWQELTDGNPDVLIRYNAVGDGNTTQLCNGLNGVTLPASDPFWKKYTPPNHFNCRSVIQEGEKIKKPGDDIPDIEPIFAFNPANEMQIFSENHPYFNYE
jgi:SPP1 gp7 family putative phage head morphogenesis protein